MSQSETLDRGKLAHDLINRIYDTLLSNHFVDPIYRDIFIRTITLDVLLELGEIERKLTDEIVLSLLMKK